MGNLPGKITGRYQSYDINTATHLTPPMTLRRNTQQQQQQQQQQEHQQQPEDEDHSERQVVFDYINSGSLQREKHRGGSNGSPRMVNDDKHSQHEELDDDEDDYHDNVVDHDDVLVDHDRHLHLNHHLKNRNLDDLVVGKSSNMSTDDKNSDEHDNDLSEKEDEREIDDFVNQNANMRNHLKPQTVEYIY